MRIIKKKNNILELKITVTEKKNSLEGLSGRFELAQEWIHEFESRLMEIFQYEEQEEKHRNMNRTIETCGTLSSISMFMDWKT